jgi:uncharacterized protein (TIGR02268 family)
MRKFLPLRSALFLVLVASVAMAREREPVSRSLYLSDESRHETKRVRVAGEMATVLRFAELVDPARTKMLGWEGRFEPLLAGGRLVVITPVNDLSVDDRFLLVVTLQNGKEVPFTVMAGDDRFDHQVNIFPDPETLDATRKRLSESITRELALQKEKKRLEQEGNSVDHAFATLLANGAVKQTPFVQDYKGLIKEGDVEMIVRVFSGRSKAAAVFEITNRSAEKPWSLLDARLSTVPTGLSREFALRMNRDELAPGQSGTLAVVADRSAFASEGGPVALILELFGNSGLQQGAVLLDYRLLRK